MLSFEILSEVLAERLPVVVDGLISIAQIYAIFDQNIYEKISLIHPIPNASRGSTKNMTS